MGIDHLQGAARWLLLVVVTGLAGCGGSVESEPVQPASPPPVKPMLEEIAASGEVGSGAETIREALTALKASEGAKAEELLAWYARERPAHTLRTFADVERLWATVVLPRLPEFRTMQPLWAEQAPPAPDSPWFPNWPIPPVP